MRVKPFNKMTLSEKLSEVRRRIKVLRNNQDNAYLTRIEELEELERSLEAMIAGEAPPTQDEQPESLDVESAQEQPEELNLPQDSDDDDEPLEEALTVGEEEAQRRYGGDALSNPFPTGDV